MRRIKRSISAAALTAAAATTIGLSARLSANTLTWTGTTRDPDSPSYTITPQGGTAGFSNGMNLYLWNTSVANWASGGAAANYTVGDDVIFTDSFAGGNVIRLSSGNLNPSSMTFRDAGAGATTYTIIITGDFLDGSGGTGGAPPSLSGSSPFGTNHSTVLTLDTGFDGKVVIRPRASAGLLGGLSNTIVKSGILELSDGGGPPNINNANAPLLNLAGGQFNVNVNVGGNTTPASTQLVGTLTVSANSVIANAAPGTVASSRVWGDNGTLSIASGMTLTVKSLNGSRVDVGSNWIGTGTILLQDAGAGTVTQMRVTTNFKNVNGNLDLGVGQSEMLVGNGSITYDIGALYGGANTKLTGSSGGNIATFSIGARGDSTTYNGVIQDNGTQSTGQSSVFKVGAGTLTLAGANTSTGNLTANAGTIVLTNTGNWQSSIANNNGTIVIGGASGSVAGGGSLQLNRGGLIRVDNSVSSNNDRLSNTASVSLQGGTLEFVGNLASATAESAGTLSATGASSTVKTVASGVGSPASLTFAALSRTNGQGVVNFIPDPNVNIGFTSAPTLSNGIIGGYATANTNNWATLTAGAVANYVHTAGETNSAPGTWGPTFNVDLTAGGTSNVTASTTINSLHIDSAANVAISAGQGLILSTGGLLSTGTAGGTVSGTGTLTAGNGAGSADLIVTVADPANTLTVTAPISDQGATGTVSLVKAGPGKLLIGTSGTYTGGVRVYGGTLATTAANVLPSAGALIVDFGQTFDLGGFSQGVATVSLINGSIVNSGGAATLTGTSYDVRSGTISAVLGGSALLTKTTSSTVTLAAANTYTGGTVLGAGSTASGTTVAAVANAFPAGGSLTILNATANVGAFNQSLGTITIGAIDTSGNNLAAGNLQGTSGVVTTSAAAVTLNNGTIGAIIGGTSGLNKATTNNGTITSLNTYTGVTTLTSGVLNVTTLDNGGAASGIGQSTSAAANLVFAGGQLTYIGSGASTDRLFTLSSAGTINSSGTGPLTLSNTSAFTGTQVFTLGGTNTGANTYMGLVTGSAGLFKAGASNWILTQPQTYTGQTTINSGSLNIGTNNLNVANFLLNGGAITGTTGIVTATTYDIQSGRAEVVLAGAIGLTKSSGGVATLTANNTYSGVVSMTGGTLAVPSLPNGSTPSPLGQSSNAATNLLINAATLQFLGATQSTDRNFTMNGNAALDASGTGSITFASTNTIPVAGGAALTLAGSNTGANTLAMLFSGTGGLTKTGGGQWLPTAANTYTGVTTLNGGTLTTSSLANGGVASNIGQSTNVASNLIFTGGTLRYTGSGASTDRLFQMGNSTFTANGTLDSSGSGALMFTNTGAVVQSGVTNRALGLIGSNTGNNTVSMNLTDGVGSLLGVTKGGSGKWILNGSNSYTGTTLVTNGTLQLGANAWAPVLTGASGANITTGRIVFDYSASSTPAAQVLSILTASYANGFLTGQMRSTTATPSIALGWKDDTANSQVIVRRVLYGDADLSGTVDTIDFGFLVGSFAQTGKVWADADFNYDGTVNSVDFNLLASNFGATLPAPAVDLLAATDGGSMVPADGGSIGGLVPEPASCSLLLAGAGMLAARRRRRV